MGFSDKQLKTLRRNLDHRRVRTRFANGRELSYIEGWYAISQANRIFGFDAWSRETVESRCVLTRENRGAYPRRLYGQGAHYSRSRRDEGSSARAMAPAKAGLPRLAKCTIPPSKQPRPMPPSVRWRPLANRSDLSFIARINPLDRKAARSPAARTFRTEQRFGLHPDDTTPIPRPSHYYGRRHHSATKDFIPNTKPETTNSTAAAANRA